MTRSVADPAELEQFALDQTAAEDDDLAASLAALSRLSSGQLSLEQLLTQVATFAVQAIPGADGAGLTLDRGGPGRHDRDERAVRAGGR